MSLLHRRRGSCATTAAVIAAIGVATVLAPLAPGTAVAAASTAPAPTAPARTIALATAPAAAPAADASYPLRSVTEKLGPGITLDRRTSLTGDGWFDDQVLTVDLAQPAVSTDLITAGPGVSDRGPISTAANARGAVAATNGDFFDIDGSGAPLGAAVQGGDLLKSAQIGGRVQVGITRDRIASLVDAAIEATATLGGTPYPVLALNTVNGSSPADALIAFTPGWGTASRSRGLEGAPAVVEALVVDGAIRSVTDAAGTGAIPAGAFVLQARGASAAALRALPIGTPAALDYRLKDELAGRMNMVIGANAVLVRDGAVVQQSDTSLAPRTALGIKDDGRTLVLFTTDGRQTLVPGRTLTSVAQQLISLGVQTAVNLDGGGSTTLVARAAGDRQADVRNRPSDGAERIDPNGVGVFVSPSSRGAGSLVVRPRADQAAVRAGTVRADAVFPGLRRSLTVSAVDANLTPRSLPAAIAWFAGRARIIPGAGGATVIAPAGDGSLAVQRRLAVSASAGSVRGGISLTVLGPLHSLETSQRRLALPGAGDAAAVHLDVTGRDAQGYAAPVELGDLGLDYDRSVLRITADNTGLRITPLRQGATLMTLTAAGVRTTLPVTVGVTTTQLYSFDAADEVSRWTTNGTVPAEQKLLLQDGKLRLDFTARRNQGVTFTGTPALLTLPGAPLRVRVSFTSSRAMQFSSLRWVDGAGVNGGFLGPAITAGKQSIDWVFPSGTLFPIRLTYFQAVETDALKQGAGTIVFDSIAYDSAPAIDVPALGAPRPDPLLSPDGTAPSSPGTWNYATLSDVQFTAANPELAKVGVAALKRIGTQHPDLVVLNGDVTDLGAPQDISLARKTLEAGGCDLVTVDAPLPANYTPDSASGRFPCYYVPGNHESYRVNGQGDLAPFVAEFGRPYRTFDHKGTRLILLNSALGTLRGSDFAQYAMLQSALQQARSDASIKNVLVFAHHPVDDPEEAATSQLGDRMEVALIEKMLSDFRTSTGKGAAMTGSHAQVLNVHRLEGVPYTVLPSSGKAPYGTPERGGFTGFVNWTVDPTQQADGRWLTGDVHAFAQSVRLTGPGSLKVGGKTTVTGTLVQPDGIAAGTRVVPLRYPMSVHWIPTSGLALGSGAAALTAAKKAGRTAILDPTTGVVTAIKAGTISVRVSSESMREYTGTASLAPVIGSTVITVKS